MATVNQKQPAQRATNPDRPALNAEQRKNILEYINNLKTKFYAEVPIRTNLEVVDRYYSCSYGSVQSAKDALVNMLGGKFRAPDIVVPMVMTQIETATGKLASTFLEGSPIFSAGATPEYEDAALQFNTIITENSTRGGWDVELSKMFRNGFKYNICGARVDWESQVTWSVANDDNNEARRVEVVWSGNTLKCCDMYNTWWDWRIPPGDVAAHGDFVGYSDILPTAEMKAYTNKLYGLVNPATVAAALNTKPPSAEGSDSANLHGGYYIPRVGKFYGNGNSKAITTNFDGFFGSNLYNPSGTINYSSVYIRDTVYVRIIPATFNLGGTEANHPQIFKATIINGSVLFDFERQTNMHNLFPVVLCQALNDGLSLQTNSMAENLMGFQDVSSAMYNALLYSKRRAVMDRAIYNPLYVDEKDVNSINPAAKIKLRGAALDMDISRAYYSIPYVDNQSGTFVSIAGAMERFSYLAAGNNPVQQGQFVKGNKTKQEVDDVSEGTEYREKLAAMSFRSSLLIPCRAIMLVNTLQYQKGATYTNAAENKAVEIDPVRLRQATLYFKFGDGFSPQDREMSTEEYQVALQTLQSVPAIGTEYRVGELFGYMMKLRGADLRPFKLTPEEITYNQQMAVWQQQAQYAADKGVPFSVPMPVPPSQEQLTQAKQSNLKTEQATLAAMVAAGQQQKGATK